MKGGLKMKAYGLETRGTSSSDEAINIKAKEQGGSMLLEAIIVLGMIATFTPLLYKHVSDRRADIENINRANTLIYLQQKTEEYLKDPDNITALVDELGHDQHKEIDPSELGIGTNFDGRYIIGIRREDENNKPVLKAMIIDTVNTGSDLRASKVAELIGVSAGIYTAVDPDAAWGINGTWSEPLEKYFTTTDIPTGAVAVTTEYNKEKYRVNISDILVDSDLDMGEFEVTAEQINAINLAVENGTIDQLTATDVRASNKVVAGTKLCVGGEEAENCIESWEGLGGGEGDTSDLMLVQLCNAGMTESCALAFAKDLNTSCSKVDAVYSQFGQAFPTPKVYSITYGTGGAYDGYIRVKCEGTQFVVDNISTATLSNPVEQVGDTAFGITTPGWYQITLMGEAGWQDNYMCPSCGAGGILIANTYYDADTLISLKGIKGGISGSSGLYAGAGVALWDSIVTTGTPTLVAGGGARGSIAGSGYIGGNSTKSNDYRGYSWDGTLGNSADYCATSNCNIGATGGRWKAYSSSDCGYGGTGYCGSGYTCTTITGGNGDSQQSDYTNYPNSSYGNWGTNTLTGGAGYASIRWCGPSGSASACPATCTSDSDCTGGNICKNAICQPRSCSTNSDCTDANYPYCTNNACTNTPPAGTVVLEITNISTNTLSSTVAQVGTYTIPVAGKYQIRLMGEMGHYEGQPNWSGAGGILIANTYYDTDTLITLKGIKGGPQGSSSRGGAGIALWDTINTTGAPTLVAGGGAGGVAGAGGYNGGKTTLVNSSVTSGYSWDGTLGTNTTYCDSTSCNIGATGGRWWTTYANWGGYGGTGYCGSGYTCTQIAGGSTKCVDRNNSNCPSENYPAATYGNWNTDHSKALGYATIVYCGPNADSPCPASCGNGVVCTTGSCNYHTGLCE